jgi:hypothetical protein
MTIAKLSRTKNNGHNTSLVIISTSLAKLAWEVFRDDRAMASEYPSSSGVTISPLNDCLNAERPDMELVEAFWHDVVSYILEQYMRFPPSGSKKSADNMLWGVVR